MKTRRKKQDIACERKQRTEINGENRGMGAMNRESEVEKLRKRGKKKI
jgi:hypothetical protein